MAMTALVPTGWSDLESGQKQSKALSTIPAPAYNQKALNGGRDTLLWRWCISSFAQCFSWVKENKKKHQRQALGGVIRKRPGRWGVGPHTDRVSRFFQSGGHCLS